MSTDLTGIGEALLALASDAQRPAAEEILARTRERRLRVLVAGEAKRGKSTLLNRLLDRDLLPTGVLPVTAISTTVRYGDADELRVRYLDGRTERHRLDELARFVTERANPENTLRVADVEAVLSGGRLAGHPVELVDTPGTGSVFEHNTKAAQDAYAGLDAVVLVVSASPPMSAAEHTLLHEVSRHAVRTFLVINKADQLTADELAETVEFTASLSKEASSELFPMSARDADGGFVAFRAAFESYLAERAEQDSALALRGHLLRLAQGMHDEAAVELRAVELARGTGRARLAAFDEHLAGLAAQAGELADRCHATERRLRRELGDQARELITALVRQARAEVASALEPIESAAEVEQHGRQLVADTVGPAVLEWRDARARDLAQQLAGLLELIEAERLRHLESLRRSARDELGLNLGATVEPLPLHSGRLFWLDFAPPPAIELPGARLLRAHGPGAARRARERVLAEIPELTDKQVGRARGDLQQRLGETVRQLVAALRLHHADTLTRLHDALTRARDAGERDSAQADAELDRLRDRLSRIDAVLADLA
jgi:small GTP-binding protein